MAAIFDKDLARDLSNLEVPNRVQFSPDGTKIAYSTSLKWGQRVDKNNLSTIWLALTNEPGSSKKLTSGSFNDLQPTWLPDGSGIVFSSDRFRPGQFPALCVLRLDESEATAITPAEHTEGIVDFSISPDSGTIAFCSADEKSDVRKKEGQAGDPGPPDVFGEDLAYARLRLVDIQSKETRQIVGGERHILSMDWSPDGKQLVFQSKQGLEFDEALRSGTTISSVNIASGEVRDLCTVMNDVSSLKWAPDGKVNFISNYAPQTACSGKAVFSIDPRENNPITTRVAFGVDDDATGLTVAGGRLLAIYQSRLATVVGEVNGSIISAQDTNLEAWDVYFDHDNGSKPVLAASLSDINHPYEVFVIKEGQSRVQLSDHGRSLQGRSFGSCTVLHSQSSDGSKELDGLYIMPSAKAGIDGRPTEPLPTFVIIHGGPTDRDRDSFDSTYFNWPPYILSQGYGVLLPQYRGSAGRGENFAACSRSGVGDFDYSDIIRITDHAIQSGFADAKKLMVGGWSQGGYLSYLCSVRNGMHGLGWRFNAVVAGAGVSDWDSMTLESDCGAGFAAEMSGGRPPWKIPKDCTASRKGSAIYEVAHAVDESRRVGKMVIPPMLILHGTADERVPFPQSNGFRRALRSYGLPCEFVAYPGQGHIPFAQRYWIDMLERLGRWCHDYIGPGAATMLD